MAVGEGGNSFEIHDSAHAIHTSVTRPLLEIWWPVLPFLLSPQNPNKNKFESKEEEGRVESQEVGLVKVSNGPILRCGKHPWASSM